jgi:HAD superfamily hydrolase (TIGR01509 family)
MTNLLNISTIIFDMDGLMLDTERVAQRVWRQASAEMKYDLPDEVYLQVVGRTAKDTEVMFLQSFGPDFPYRAMYERKQQLMYALLENEGVPTMPGLFELLDLIDDLGLAKAVATSTARELASKKLTLSGLIDRFEVIVAGDEIVHGKPAPDIFLNAAARLGSAPVACMVLEDSEAGVKGAHAAGMTPVMVPNMKQPTPEVRALAYRVLTDLHEVGALLRSWHSAARS